MTNEETFRNVLLAGILVFGPVGLFYRLKSHSGEKLDRRQEGWFILIALRVLALIAGIGLISYLVDPARMNWSSVSLPKSLRWSGVVFGLLGGGLMVWTFRCLGPNLTDTVVTRRQHTLITRGPYRWVRHPFYLAAALVSLAASVLTANILIGVSGFLMLTLLFFRTRKEEENLIARFGEIYKDYMRRTGRFLPKL